MSVCVDRVVDYGNDFYIQSSKIGNVTGRQHQQLIPRMRHQTTWRTFDIRWKSVVRSHSYEANIIWWWHCNYQHFQEEVAIACRRVWN